MTLLVGIGPEEKVRTSIYDMYILYRLQYIHTYLYIYYSTDSQRRALPSTE